MMKAILVLISVCMLTAPAVFIIAEQPGTLSDDQNVIKKDTDSPVSTMTTSDRFIITNSFQAATLEWWGVDEAGGSGLSYFDIQMMYVPLYDPDKDVYAAVLPYWKDYLMNTTETCDSFHPSDNAIYYFRCRAVDVAGNVEDWPEYFDTFVIGLGWDPALPEMPEHYDGMLERVIVKLEYINDQIVEIPENPDGVLDRTIYRLEQAEQKKQEIQDTIHSIRENWQPVADAGEDQTDVIVYKPFDEPEKPNEGPPKDTGKAAANMDFPEVKFDGSASYDPDGEISHYIWDFGDGFYGYSAIVSHTYLIPGDYNVTLTVIDNDGGYNNDSLKCNIAFVSF